MIARIIERLILAEAHRITATMEPSERDRINAVLEKLRGP